MKRVQSLELDNIKYNVIRKRFALTDFLLTVKLHKKPFFADRFQRKVIEQISGYDAVMAHSFYTSWIARATASKL